MITNIAPMQFSKESLNLTEAPRNYWKIKLRFSSKRQTKKALPDYITRTNSGSSVRAIRV
jgi:hypothetical protein